MTQSLVTLWTSVRRRLEAAGIDTPVIDARLLLEAGAGVSRLDIITDPRRELSDEQVAGVEALTTRREAREPIAYILGRKHFWTFELAVSPAVLTPRPETETLVQAALALLPDAAARVLDLGVGSGAILLAILSERTSATGLGVDVSEAALAVAEANARALGLQQRSEWRLGDWATNIGETFDLVVSNPPYIRSADIAALAPEVRAFEPKLALDGGSDGLSAYRTIAAELPRLLKPGGAFALEVGQGQAEAVEALAVGAGLLLEPSRSDLGGVVRVVQGRRAAG